MKFGELVDYLEYFERETGRIALQNKLNQLLRKAYDEKLLKEVVALTIPTKLTDDLGVSDGTVIRALRKITSVKDIRYKDIGDLAFKALKGRGKYMTLFDYWGYGKELDVVDIVYSFERIRRCRGLNDKVKIIVEYLSQMNPIEAKWYVKILTNNFRHHIGIPTVLNSLEKIYGIPRSKMEDYLESVGGNILELLEALDKGEMKIETRLYKPISPMLAVAVKSFTEVLKRGAVLVQYKLDGFRIQAHCDGTDIRLYTRNLEEATSFLPEIVEELKNKKLEKTILDGEIIALDEKGRMIPFQKIIMRRRKYHVSEMARRMPVKYAVFDVLMYKGMDVRNLAVVERLKILEKVLGKPKSPWETTDKVFLLKYWLIDEMDELKKLYREAVERCEGLMAKLSTSIYRNRRSEDWMKLKKSYLGELGDTVDLLVVGWKYGTGKRAKYPGSLLLACRYGNKLKEIGWVGSGLTDEDLVELKKILEPITISNKPDVVLSNVKDVHWVDLDKTIVVEVLADCLTLDFKLRFPRVIRLRPDKKTGDVDDFSKVVSIFGLC